LQPLDVSLNRPFKNNIRKLWADWMVNSAHELTKAGRLKRPSYVEVVNWVRNAWDNIPKDMVVKSFKVCGISNAQDGSDDGLIGMPEEGADDNLTEQVLLLDDLVLELQDIDVSGDPEDYVDDCEYENNMEEL